VLPIVTPAEMRAVDGEVAHDLQRYIDRSGAAVARAAVRMLGGTYGRTVQVLVGKGNNGADGRVAAALLAARGVKVSVIPVEACPAVLAPCHLVIDAAFGTGFRGAWAAPDAGDALVLAVDLPSGLDAHTGEAPGPVMPADRTVTFQALKPGLLLADGPALAGEVEVADIGLADGVSRHCRAHLVQADDVARWLPPRSADAHKWRSAVRVVAGSTGMTGAAALAGAAALRTGAGMVHLSSVGCLAVGAPPEVVQLPLPAHGWARPLLDSLDRFHAMVIGPGLGRDDATADEARLAVLEAAVPVVVDGDGLFAMAWNAEGAAALLRRRQLPTVLTPHDGEFRMLTGAAPSADRLDSARRLAAATNCVVLLKGSATVVADPSGEVLVSNTGDQRLATAGTGDVLAGIVGSLLAQGVPALRAAAAGAWLHGRAAMAAPSMGMVAGDIAQHLPGVLEALA
jgi:NAD(P)H-hydrate epimerase